MYLYISGCTYISIDNLPSQLNKHTCISDLGSTPLQSLKGLIESALDLKGQLSHTIANSVKELNDLTSKHTESTQKLNDQLSRTIVNSVKELKESSITHPVSAFPSPKSGICTNDIDRRNNVIIFGLEEKPLNDTRNDVESILEFLCGRPVAFSDAFRLGRINTDVSDRLPRPLLVKLSSTWDRRLILAAKRNLKNFSIKRLFVREDLSPEMRQQRAQRRNEKSENGISTRVQDSLRSHKSSVSICEDASSGAVNQQ